MKKVPQFILDALRKVPARYRLAGYLALAAAAFVLQVLEGRGVTVLTSQEWEWLKTALVAGGFLVAAGNVPTNEDA